MKRFIIFLNKEFFHIFRDTRTLVILFGMPIALVVLFGFAITNEVKDAHIAILDQSKDKATRAITDRLLSSGYFMLDDNLQSVEDIEQSFKKGTIKIALVFEPKFEKKLAQRVTEKYCVCERIIETIDESTGEVVNTVTEKVCDDKVTSMSSENSNIVDMIEKKIQDKKISPVSLGLTVLIGIQVIALVYYMFFM